QIDAVAGFLVEEVVAPQARDDLLPGHGHRATRRGAWGFFSSKLTGPTSAPAPSMPLGPACTRSSAPTPSETPIFWIWPLGSLLSMLALAALACAPMRFSPRGLMARPALTFGPSAS